MLNGHSHRFRKPFMLAEKWETHQLKQWCCMQIPAARQMDSGLGVDSPVYRFTGTPVSSQHQMLVFCGALILQGNVMKYYRIH